MSNASPTANSKRRAQYVSRACNECRRRRCKCDGGQPSCGSCVFYGRECSWSAENDARLPATKQLVESLDTKIHILETELVQLKERSGVPTESDQEPSTPLDNNIAFPLDQAEPSPLGRKRPEPSSVQIIAATKYRYIFDLDASVPSNQQPRDVHLSLVCQWDR
ncbi:hypothetical protein RSOLAG22IIIB_12571 [Rhizoctonia solani]|uniref:Zn(2)-C6 fungal-type domain-containing protein n=1 Tax=Rhizoctonia solani TaxID=456999 RepID=A0A0K6GFA6_9AGAM|nr:unnamed protein product [Rhizoctonia solani]CUA77151.1 hypothetical protein RSOLAG22IIIB_12571 [Rhizoctonia solani]